MRKGYGDRLLIDSLSFSLPAGGIVGIIGPNGAGKTTLFRMLSGAEKPDSGEIRLGPSVKLAYVDQSRQALNDKNTVWQEISGGLDLIKVGNYETSSRGYVGRFNFKGVQQQQVIGDLSGGERNRVHLAKVLKAGGNVLLLDEPTNDLDIETLRALEDALVAFPGCAVVISHDRWFLDRIATHILAFEGDSQVVWFEGNYQEYVEDYKKRKGEDAAQPHRIRYKPLTGLRTTMYITPQDELHVEYQGIALTCPHCQTLTHLTPVAVPKFEDLSRRKPKHIGIVFRCDACMEPIFLKFAVKAYTALRVELASNLRGNRAGAREFSADLSAGRSGRPVQGGAQLLRGGLFQCLRRHEPAHRPVAVPRTRRARQAGAVRHAAGNPRPGGARR